MKKYIVILLSLAMLCSLLTGCGSSSATETQPAPTVKKISPASSSYTVYVRCYSGWDVPRVWAWSETDGDLYDQWPGEAMKMGSDGWYALRIPSNYDYVVVNGQDGNIQTEDEYTGGKDMWFTIEEESYYTDYTKPTDSYEAPNAQSDPDGYIAELEGEYESVHMNVGNSSLNVHALVFDQTIYNCYEMTVHMSVTMHNGTNCKDWQLWGRSGGTFVKLEKIYLEAGDGNTSQTIHFTTPVTFDAIVITPTIPGGYSWSLGVAVTDVWTK